MNRRKGSLWSVLSWIGGLVALFLGYNHFSVWIGIAAFLFAARLFDILRYKSSDRVRLLSSLAAGFLVALVVNALQWYFLAILPLIGGFLAVAALSLRVVTLTRPQAGLKELGLVAMISGVMGAIIFSVWLPFNLAIMLVSVMWGAGVIGNLLTDKFDWSLGVQTLIWVVLAILGYLVQRSLWTVDYHELIPASFNGLLLLVLGIAFAIFAVVLFTREPELEGDLSLVANGKTYEPPQRPVLNLNENDRLLILAPHPDDEVLATGGVIQQALEIGLPVRVVYFTTGDHNQGSFALYRKQINLDPEEAIRLGIVRHDESLSATAELGLSPEKVTFLGYPDFGMLEVWEKRWGDSEPYRAMLNRRNAVPYDFAQSPGAPFSGEPVLQDITKVLKEFKPTKLFLSHPGDVHPDHQALPLFTQVALWDLAEEISPELYFYMTHFGRWPQPRELKPETPLEPPKRYDIGDRWHVIPLTQEQRRVKFAALKKHATQYGTGKVYLESFIRSNELFDTISEIVVSQAQTGGIAVGGSDFDGVPLERHTAEEQAAFVGTELRSASLVGDELVFYVEYEKPLSEKTQGRGYAMGYRMDKPFGEMPKLFIEFSKSGYKVYNHGQQMPEDVITVVISSTHREIRLPLALLGNPERVFMTAQTHTKGVPLDHIPWLYLDLRGTERL